MANFREFFDHLQSFAPSAATLLVLIVTAAVLRRAFRSHGKPDSGRRFVRRVVAWTVWSIGLALVFILLPFETATRGQLLSLLGALLGAAIALSSTTVLGNLFAGFMLRGVANVRIGDFLTCGQHFGRVTVLGALHVEIQDEERDLTTLPNLHLVQNPYHVIRSTATLISATVSLGYDVPQADIKRVLCEAAADSGLEDAFVWVTELGDFSVGYKVYGLLKNPKKLLSARAALRSSMLDALHHADIEIVSPIFHNQRRLSASQPVIPSSTHPVHRAESNAEALMFDKADSAATVERLREILARIVTRIAEVQALRVECAKNGDIIGEADCVEDLARLRSRQETLLKLVEEREKHAKETR